MAERPPDDDPRDRGADVGRGDQVPDLPTEWAGLVIPDDASELWLLTQQIRRERRAAHRRAGLARLVRGPGRSFVASMAVLALALAAILGSLFFIASDPATPPSRPLARPTSSPGAVGGLLPDLRLTASTGAQVRLRDVRPAVLLVLPATCGCRRLVADVLARAAAHGITLLVVAEGGTAFPLPAGAAQRRVRSLTDPGRQLANTYAPAAAGTVTLRVSSAPSAVSSPPVAVFVRPDGLVNRVLIGPVAGDVLHDEITALSS